MFVDQNHHLQSQLGGVQEVQEGKDKNLEAHERRFRARQHILSDQKAWAGEIYPGHGG